MAEAGPIIVEFEYAMYTEGRSTPTTLWLLYDARFQTRQINFRRLHADAGEDADSGWHGTWEYHPYCAAFRLHFNYRGVQPWRWCELHRTFNRHCFIGCDYKFRFVRMSFRRALRYGTSVPVYRSLVSQAFAVDDEWEIVLEAALTPLNPTPGFWV